MARKKSKRKSGDHSAAFITGSLLGGLTGAILALWKTPQSGFELRQKVAGPLGLAAHEPEMPFITTPISNEPVPEPDPETAAPVPPAPTTPTVV